MKVRILGSGTSSGVPRVGGAAGIVWGLCDPAEPRNRRTRASILIESDAGARLLVDTSTDLRVQMLAAEIDRIDAVFWTHDHADHAHGIDDLRPFRYGRNGPLPGYAVDETVRRLRLRFDYVFAGQFGYPTIVAIEALGKLRMCHGIGIGWCGIGVGVVELLAGCDVLVVDCLRIEPHPTHANLAMALELVEATRSDRAALTHLDKSMDYATVSAQLPAHVVVGYDGLEIVA